MKSMELASFAALTMTSIEVMGLVAEKAEYEAINIMTILINRDKELEAKAFENTEEDELEWVGQTIYRNQGE